MEDRDSDPGVIVERIGGQMRQWSRHYWEKNQWINEILDQALLHDKLMSAVLVTRISTRWRFRFCPWEKRGRDRQTDRQADRQKQRQREAKTDIDREIELGERYWVTHRDTETDPEKRREREGGKEEEKDTERWRKKERKTQKRWR